MAGIGNNRGEICHDDNRIDVLFRLHRPPCRGAVKIRLRSRRTGNRLADKARPDKLASLLAELKELQGQQMKMSNKDYLFASLSLKEQISTERLNAGEDLDVIGVRFEGRVFNLAGKVFGPGSLDAARIPDSEMVQLARPGDKLRSYLAQQQAGIDIQG